MKLLLLFLVLSLFGCSRCEDVTLLCAEGAECWPDAGTIPNHAYVGDCAPGVLLRGSGGDCVCVGARLPVAETCDGRDEDCNGIVDRGRLARGTDDPDNTCDLCGYCQLALQICIDGRWVCDPYLGPTEEVCDGSDNDCDCEVDEGITTQYFYDGPVGTDGVGQCRPGVIRCEYGEERVSNPITPVEEVCDGLDNDCDGVVDDGNEDNPKAFLLVIDVSGSMGGTIDAVTDALCDFAVSAPSGSRFAVVRVSYGINPQYITLAQDFNDAAETCATLQTITTNGLGNEYMLEGTLLAGGLEWPNLRHVVAEFTDEPLQILDPASPDDVLTECAEIPYELAVFTLGIYAWQWDPFVNSCGGTIDPLLDDRYAFVALLLERFFGECR